MRHNDIIYLIFPKNSMSCSSYFERVFEHDILILHALNPDRIIHIIFTPASL